MTRLRLHQTSKRTGVFLAELECANEGATISARDAAALDALQRGLPHYGAQSWRVFDGSRTIAKGTWPASLPVTVTGR